MESQLVTLYEALRRNREYQTLLKKTLEDVAERLKCVETLKRKVANAPKAGKPGKRRKRRPPLQYDPCFKLLTQVTKEDKSKVDNGPFLVPGKSQEIIALHEKCGNQWMKIGTALNLSPVTCFRTYHAAIGSLQFSHKLLWTDEEDILLTKAVQRFGTNSWQEVANSLEAKTNSQCYHRWMKTLNPRIKRGKWTWEEDVRLALAVKVYSTSNWVSIAEHVHNRTDIQCRERYCNVLNPSLRSQDWDGREDWKLTILVLALGKRWSRIAGFLPGRTDNQCWRRFKHLRKHSKILSVFTLLKTTGLIRGVRNRKLKKWMGKVGNLVKDIRKWCASDKVH